MIGFLWSAVVVDSVRFIVAVNIVNDQRSYLLQMIFEVPHLLVPCLLVRAQVIVKAVCMGTSECGIMLAPIDAVDD